MRFFALARSATMMLCAASASILSCAAVADSAAAAAAAICAQRAVRSSGSILRNIALGVTILILIVAVFFFWICKLSGGGLAWLF